MGAYIGNATANKIAVGNVESPSGYVGTDKVWPNFPTGYEKLEYLQSDGTAFIKLPWRVDIGAPASNIRNLNDGYKIKFALSDDQQAAFGSREAYFLKSENGYMWARCINDSSSNVVNTNIPFTTNPQTWKYEAGKLYHEETLIKDFWNPVHSSSGFGTDLYLFGRNTGSDSSAGNNGTIKIYYLEHSTEIPSTSYPNITFKLYPAKRKSDNVLGMIDLLSNTFYTNGGGGAFIAPV